MDENFGVAIPYAEPRRYVALVKDLNAATPEITALVLTGEAYGYDCRLPQLSGVSIVTYLVT